MKKKYFHSQVKKIFSIHQAAGFLNPPQSSPTTQTVTSWMCRTLDMSKDIQIIGETRQRHVFKTTSVSCGVKSSCVYGITAQKAHVQEREGVELSQGEPQCAEHKQQFTLFPQWPRWGKNHENDLSVPVRTDASGDCWASLATPRHKHFRGQKSKQALNLPTFPVAFQSTWSCRPVVVSSPVTGDR